VGKGTPVLSFFVLVAKTAKDIAAKTTAIPAKVGNSGTEGEGIVIGEGVDVEVKVGVCELVRTVKLAVWASV
jgi:hypothetical protein